MTYAVRASRGQFQRFLCEVDLSRWNWSWADSDPQHNFSHKKVAVFPRLAVDGMKAAATDLAAALRDTQIPEADKIARVAGWQRRFMHEVRVNIEQFAPPAEHAQSIER